MERVSRAAPSHDLVLRRGLLLVIGAAAVTGVLAGLGRLGVALAWGPRYASDHGPLLVLGTFGTVIALERAVALARLWGFAAPSLGAVAAIGFLVGSRWVPWVTAASAVVLVALNVAILRRQVAAFTGVMLLGSTVLVVGDLAWALGRPVFEVVPAWLGFFVLTIVSERLELSRLAPTPRWATVALVALTVVLALSSCASAVGVGLAPRMLGITLVPIGAWQLRFDLARRTFVRSGLPRFAALGVLLGAGWLLVTGVVVASNGIPATGPLYDAELHGVFVGYVLSMVFAHAPIILPAVARVNVTFSPLLHLPLAILHLGLASRVVGDLAGQTLLRRAGGIANAVALVVFVLVVGVSRTVEDGRREGVARDA